MRIAIMGTRGIPAMYGGFETMAWELSQRLAALGHDVTVYCREGRTDETVPVPAGVRRRFLPCVPGKYMETVSHTALSVLDALIRPYDVIFIANAANALVSGVPRLRGPSVVLNVDGIERQRAKWGLAGRMWYTLGERFALVYPNVIVADADVIRDYYRDRYGKATTVIAYGAAELSRHPEPDLAAIGLSDVRAGEYFLYVSRLEPENQADLVVRAYASVPGTRPLLVVGDAPHAATYKARLRELAARDGRVRLLGGIYGDGYRDLQRGALAYIQATSVGGTHPALIEAMAAGNVVLAFDTPENREVVRGAGRLFRDEHELADHLAAIDRDPTNPAWDRLRTAALERVRAHYSWDAVADAYDLLFRRMRTRSVHRGQGSRM
jgi:glycosyltransferase involved in cell wall biosynthesis